MNLVGLIFARGGSKGLPNKNILKLGDKELIGWSITQALEINRLSRLIVSTDSIEIAELALKYGAEVPFMRPKELASDDSPEWLSWQHALSYIQTTSGRMPDAMVSIPTTSPLRHNEDIENCIDLYSKGLFDVVITISDTNRNPYFNMVKKREDGTVELLMTLNKNLDRRQDAPVVFDMATVCYVANSNFVMTKAKIFDGRVGAVYVPKERAIDIDTPYDFKLAEIYYSDKN